MHGNARRLVQHGGKRILVGDVQRDILRHHIGLRLRRQHKADRLPGAHNMVRMYRGSVAEKAPAVILDRLDQPGGQALCAQKKVQALRRHTGRQGVFQLGHKRPLFCA